MASAIISPASFGNTFPGIPRDNMAVILLSLQYEKSVPPGAEAISSIIFSDDAVCSM